MKFVKEQIKKLQKHFSELKESCRLCLEKKEIPFQGIIDTLKYLPADKEYSPLIGSYMNVLSQTFNLTGLFGALGLYMNYLSYQLLEYFVHNFHLEEVKSKIEDYRLELQKFRLNTPITLFCEAQPIQGDIEPPPNFQAVKSVFLSDESGSKTLEYIEHFKKEISDFYILKPYTMMFAKANLGSLTVTWFIPESVAKKLSAVEPPKEILRKYSVTDLEISGGCVYRLRRHHKVSVTIFVSI